MSESSSATHLVGEQSPRTSLRRVDEMTYEELVGELAAVTQSMDDGAIGIEEVALLYTRASELHATATKRLADVTARIEQLRGGSPA